MTESIETCQRFDRYFERAISEWPEEVEVKTISFKGDNKEIFSTSDMYDLSEKVSHAYLGRDDEVIMRHLHDCIYIVMHFAAKHVTLIRPRDLRRSEVREIFENMLRTISREHGWRDLDFATVDAYFDEK